MKSKPVRRQIVYFVIFVLGQLPLLYDWVLFNYAFVFIYIAFLLFLPLNLSRFWQLAIAFGVGLFIDIFSNTPGLHAMVSLLTIFIRPYWLNIVVDNVEELEEVNLEEVNLLTFLGYVFPLLFFHLSLLFIIENEGVKWFKDLSSKIFASTLFSLFVIWLLSAFLKPEKRRT